VIDPAEGASRLETFLAGLRFDDRVRPTPPAELVERDQRLLSGIIDWPTFWSKERGDDWLAEPLLGRGRSHALFAGAKVGKSDLILYVVACLATGTEPFTHDGRPREPVHVLYLDWEMTEDDLLDRLMDLGYGPDTDLAHLHFDQIPRLAPLDTAEGGAELLRLVELVGAEVVVVDTLGRAVEGEENSNDTVRAYYRHTASLLKAAGITQLRADHAGKEAERGQRGGSAKNDDVDVVWQLTRIEDGARLRATHKRMGWVPETVDLVRVEDPVLRYLPTRNTGSYLPGTAALADELDNLRVPLDAGRRTARKALTEAKVPAGDKRIADALRYRKDHARRGPPNTDVTPRGYDPE
jgi:hypothetical protein